VCKVCRRIHDAAALRYSTRTADRTLGGYQGTVLDEISWDRDPVFSLQEGGAVSGREEVEKRARVPGNTCQGDPLLVVYAETKGVGVAV